MNASFAFYDASGKLTARASGEALGVSNFGADVKIPHGKVDGLIGYNDFVFCETMLGDFWGNMSVRKVWTPECVLFSVRSLDMQFWTFVKRKVKDK